MIYPPLPERPTDSESYFYNDRKLIKEYNKRIDDIIGNHRDEDNEFAKKLIEFYHTKEALVAIDKIYKIKLELYNNTGIIL